MSEPRFQLTGRLVLGLVVIALGVVFTLDNLRFVDAGEILRWWPTLLIAFGLARLTGFCCRRSFTAGILFTLAGVWVLLHDLRIIRYDLGDLWPVILIVIGGGMVARSLGRSWGWVRVGVTRLDEEAGADSGMAGGAGVARREGGDSSSTFSAFALWSGLDRKVVSQDFRGGEVTAIMGGHDIDLRGARIRSEAAVIDLFVVWGGVDFRVPEDWKVSCEALPIMGGIEDRSKIPGAEPRGHLILRGLVLMGGVEVKN